MTPIRLASASARPKNLPTDFRAKKLPTYFRALIPLILTAASACHIGQPAVTVQLLAINDFHGAIEPPSGAIGAIGGVPAGGAEYLAAHISRAIADNPRSLVVAAGDLIGGAPPISSLLHEEPSVAALNAVHVAVSSVGNHEFDKGPDELLRMQRGGCNAADGCIGGLPFPGAAYRYLAANVVRKTATGSEALFPPTAIRKIGGVRIGFIGVVIQTTPQIVRRSSVEDLAFLDEADSANRYASELKRQGVNAIVLLIHDGGAQTGPGSADPNGCAGFQGPIVPVLRRLSADIRIVVSGHTHQAYNCVIGGRTVTSAAANGRMLTRINVAIDRRTDAIVDVQARNEVVTRDVPKDASETAVIARYEPFVEARTRQIVGSITRGVTRTGNPAGEVALGDIVADAELAAARAHAPGGADIAITNPGGLRADIPMQHQDGSTPPGQVSYGDLITCQPFGNVLYVTTMTGDGLRRLLEQQFHANGTATVLQVSAGFTYAYRRNAPAGQHIDPASMMLDGVRIAPDATLRIATIDFLLDGGDGFTNFGEAADRQAYATDIDALVDYFKANSPVSPPAMERIRVLN